MSVTAEGTTTSASIHQIIDSLNNLARQRRDYRLLQFQSRTGAHQYQRLYRLCVDYVQPKSQVLDWGCGNGHFSYFLVSQGHQVSGYAFNDFPLRQQLPGAQFDFLQGSPQEPIQLPYADAQFDAVFSVGVLEHVRECQGNEVGSLREIARILKPQGHFICYHLPNRHSWIEQLAARWPDKYHHQYRYTQADINRWCQQTGLTLKQSGRYGCLPRNLLSKLPGPIVQSRLVASAWDATDRLLGWGLSGICQNYYFVAQRPAA